MKSDIPLDYAVFQLSPRRSRCELFVSCDGTSEKLASGLVKPFLTHLKAVEEQFASAVKSIRLEVKRCKSSESWFTRGTLERFVRFVSTPELLELVNKFDAEMSQLEAARKIYSQEPGEGSGGDAGATTASDATKKELLRAIDVRLVAVGQDLSTACSRALAAGFNADTVSELQLFAEKFGAHHLSQSCSEFTSLCRRRPELFNAWKYTVDDQAVRCSSGSDMSLDDQTNDSQTGSLLSQYQPSQPEKLDELNSAPLQPENRPSAALLLCDSSSRESSIDKEDMKESTHWKKQEDTSLATADSESPFTVPGPPARRLSVQDRINLFENKQKESSSGSRSKPAVGKSAELRRLSSDMSSAGQMGPFVLRRWSGASDMSIDLGGERKEVDSSAGTPAIAMTKTSTSSNISEDMDRSDSNDSAISLKPETKVIDASQASHVRLENKSNSMKEDLESKPARTKLGALLTVSSGASQETSVSRCTSFSGKSESDGQKDQSISLTQSKASFCRPVDFGSEDQITSPAMPRKIEHFASRAQTSFAAEECPAGRQDCVAQKEELSRFSHDLSDCETYQDSAEHEGSRSRNQRVPRSYLRTFQRAVKDRSDSESSVFPSVSVVSQSRGSEHDQVIDPPKSRSLGQGNEVARENYESTEKQHENSSVVLDRPAAHGIKFQRHGSASALAKKSRRRDDGSGMGMPRVAGETISDNQETFSSISTASMEQAQRVKQSKGSVELNDELKLKAKELEKLYAVHKLRVPSNQSSVTRRSKSVEIQEQEASLVSRDSSAEVSTPQLASKKMVSKPSHSGDTKKFSSSPVIQPLENQDFDDTPKQNIYSLGFSDDSRGKFYDKYAQKRDAKLKEEWSSKRAEKEARMKAMQDSFERSRSEMKTKLAGSADRQDSHRRAEKFRSFNAQSAVRWEQPIHSFVSDDDEDRAETARSVQNKKAFLNNNEVSTTPRAAGAPRLSAKASASSTGRRKLQPENPLAQSVPNFSDFRKENTKPKTVSSKGIERSQVRNYTRKNSSEVVLSFEEKSQRPQHLRKSSANPLELKDLPSHNFEGIEPEDEFSRSTDVGLFLRKGNAPSIPRSKASLAAKTLANEQEEFMDNAKVQADSYSVADEEYENMDYGHPRNQESPNSGCENGDATGVPSQANPASIAEMPAALSSAFHAKVSVLDSPGESPGSWHSRIHNPYSFQHEISDFDASVDSPVGSPAYWNQNDSDAARMRKKWGAAQKPIVVSDLSHGQSRKDVTKGLKRFLKFGRKNRGTDSLVDWVSATTSEGDDDTEDGKDPANRSSEDLRKSRMGFLHYNPDDGFSETDSFSEQVHGFPSSIPTPPMNFKLREDHLSGSALKAPKSFFSLSTFRSKGSDSKPR